MNVLVIGGSGLIGGETALYLAGQGHRVTLMSRTPPSSPALTVFPHICGDYVNDDMGDGRLDGFDWLVFSAAADIRNLPTDGSVTPEDFYRRHNDEAVPRCIAAARDAGVSKVVYIGSFYAQVAPHRIAECPYVASRYNTDRAVRALTSDQFAVTTLDCPFILGHIPGTRVPYIAALVEYAAGRLPDMPVFAPPGGTNHMSSRSVAQAVLGAFQSGDPGRAYLVGDENLSWKAYLELWFREAGNPRDIEVSDEDHPLFPNAIMFAGAGATVAYDVSDDDMAQLGNYDRGQLLFTVRQVISAHDSGVQS